MEENKKPQNPLAFASQSMTADGSDGDKQEGMTLRDYFAAKAMQSFIQSDELRKICAVKGNANNSEWTDIVAENSFIMADEMLKQREL